MRPSFSISWAKLLACYLLALLCFTGGAARSWADEDPFAAGVRATPWLKPAEEQAQFKLPPGFEINLVAAEPDIQKPLNMAFDERGRIWLTCSVEYPYPVAVGTPGKDSIRILEDTDGDGQFEKVTIFAEGLNIPIGIYPWKGGCIAYSIPNIWHFEDTDGDGKSDKQTKLYGPFDHTRDTHGMCNAFRRGFDGWLYSCHGFNNDSHVKGADGHEVHLNSGNTFRFQLDGSRIEHFTHGQVNPFGMCLDEKFNLFTADCHSKPIYQLLRGGYYPSFGKPDGGLGFVTPMMEHLHGSTAICGLTYYSGDNFPPAFRKNFYSGNVMTSRINRNSPVGFGSTILAHEEPDFLSCSDPWFRPVDIHSGPDGAMYLLDFYNRIIGHYEVPLTHPGRDRTSGRMWRIAYKGNDPETKPAKTPASLSSISVPELIGQLQHPNLEYRLLVQHWLTDVVGAQCLPAVQAELTAMKKGASATVHLLWIQENLQRTTAANANLPPLLAALSGDQISSEIEIHANKMAAERNNLEGNAPMLSRALTSQLTENSVARAAADAIAQHPQVSLLKDLLFARSKVAQTKDTHLTMQLTIALRNVLEVADAQDPNWLKTLSAEEVRQLAPVCVAIKTPAAAGLLIDHLAQTDEPREKILPYLQHAARYAPPDRVDALVKLTREKFRDDIDFQASILRSMYTGFLQREVPPPAGSLQNWGEAVAKQLLSLHQGTGVSWTNIPIDGLPASESPWTLAKRLSQDGDKESFFFDSLPTGETKTGIYRCGPFTLPPKLSFWCAGHSGVPGSPLSDKNYIRLRDQSTGELLLEARPPRNDIAQKTDWDLAKFAGQQGYLEIIDAETGTGYAWLAVGRFSLPELNPSQAAQHQIAAAELAKLIQLKGLQSEFVKLLIAANTDSAVRTAVGQTLVAWQPDSRAAALVASLAEFSADSTLLEQIGKAIATREPTAVETTLAQVVRRVPQRLQTAMAELLAGDAAGVASLVALAKSGAVSPRLLLVPTVAAKIQALKNGDLQQQVKELTANLPPASAAADKFIAQRRAAYSRSQPNLENGLAIFKKNCLACHQISGQGAVVGPQLDGIGLRGLERLTEDILDPNRNVDVAFRTTTLVLDDGQVLSGLVRREEGAQLVIVDAKGKEFSVPKSSIDQQSKTSLSLMPANVSEITTTAEFCDLMGYLLSQKTKPKEP